MTTKEPCQGANGLLCLGGYLYSNVGMMIFPTNKLCPSCHLPEPATTIGATEDLEGTG